MASKQSWTIDDVGGVKDSHLRWVYPSKDEIDLMFDTERAMFPRGHPVGVLVPDDWLQSLKDIWNDGAASWREALKDWPELYDFLNMLDEEDNDET